MQFMYVNSGNLCNINIRFGHLKTCLTVCNVQYGTTVQLN